MATWPSPSDRPKGSLGTGRPNRAVTPPESASPSRGGRPAGWTHRWSWSWVRAWAAGVGTTAALYALGGAWGRVPHVLPELAPDRWIGFHPGAVWVYLSFFLMQASGFALVPATHRRALTHAFMGCATVAFGVFLLWPTTLVQPVLAGNGQEGLGLMLVRWFDTPANCLPSLHAALAAVSAAALSLRRQRWVTMSAWAWALAICWSAIATRQHLSVDIAAGWALGCGVAWALLVRGRRSPLFPNV